MGRSSLWSQGLPTSLLASPGGLGDPCLCFSQLALLTCESCTGSEEGCAPLGSVLDPDPALPAHSWDLAPWCL